MYVCVCCGYTSSTVYIWRLEDNLKEFVLSSTLLWQDFSCFCCYVVISMPGSLQTSSQFSYLQLPCHCRSTGILDVYHYNQSFLYFKWIQGMKFKRSGLYGKSFYPQSPPAICFVFIIGSQIVIYVSCLYNFPIP